MRRYRVATGCAREVEKVAETEGTRSRWMKPLKLADATSRKQKVAGKKMILDRWTGNKRWLPDSERQRSWR